MAASEMNIVGAAYQKVAICLARDIVAGKYVPGQRISGRSTLSARYGVSPETIRKAVYILKDVGILTTEKGSGIEVLSVEKAVDFVEIYKKTLTVNEIRKSISDSVEAQHTEIQKIKKNIEKLLDVTERFTTENPFEPFEITILPDSPAIGQTLSELKFWQNTGATIVGIKRDAALILSPGSYASFQENDVYYLIGTEDSLLRAKQLLIKNK